MAQTLVIDTSNKSKEQLYDEIIIKTAYKEGIELESARIYLEKPDTTYLNKLTTQLNNKQEFGIDNSKYEMFARDLIRRESDSDKKIKEIRKYEIRELLNKINKNKYFQIKSLQIFNHNPKNEFDKRTHKFNNTDYASDKLRNLEKEHVNDTTKETFGKFNKNKKIELEAYKQTVYNTEMKLDAKRRKIERDLEQLSNTSANYKLDKLSKDHYFMKKKLF
jgi:hypothetical protein